jgi:CRP/FNR family transcriptional regulator, cyclic AMP receptor protein
MKDITTLIQEHPFFAGLDAVALELVAGCASSAHFAAGEFLFHEGDAANRFYLLRGGRVQLETPVPGRAPVVLETIQAGEVIGWSWLFPPYLWHFDAQATESVRATVFDGECLRGKCGEHHDLGYELAMRSAQIMMQRLQAARLQLLDVYGAHP